MRSGLLALLLAFAGCYRPNLEASCSVSCGQNGACPGSLACDFADGLCKDHGACPMGADAPMARDDAFIDPETGRPCYGTALVVVCPATSASSSLILSASQQINTDVGGTCDTISLVKGPANACVQFRHVITIAPGATLRAIGSRPLVLVSETAFDVYGTIDVSSQLTAFEAGAGGDPTSGCGALTTPDTLGGGAGGSFGGLGGSGGDGDDKSSGHGIPMPATNTAGFRGGCPGGIGGNTSFPASPGGGAVYLIAPIALRLTGAINASGAPGHGGSTNTGGNGGGSGGMIGIDTPTLITPTGWLLADGGGGGCGGDSGPGGNGNPPMHLGASGTGCIGPTSPDGGDGSMGNADAKAGSAGSTSEGGGGGGGGAGIISLFPATLSVPDRSPR